MSTNKKLIALLILISLPGIWAVNFIALPLMVNPEQLPMPIETIQWLSMIQPTLMVVAAAIVGTLLSQKVGLQAPALSALIHKKSPFPALKPQLVPGIIGGILGAVMIVLFHHFKPEQLQGLVSQSAMPLSVRVLYGGIVEEVLIRWGLMTLLVFALWRLFQRSSSTPKASAFVIAIILSALAFGILHVPSILPALPDISLVTVAYITLMNATFAVVAGVLFWRYGLEAAIIAHSLAHVFSFLVAG